MGFQHREHVDQQSARAVLLENSFSGTTEFCWKVPQFRKSIAHLYHGLTVIYMQGGSKMKRWNYRR